MDWKVCLVFLFVFVVVVVSGPHQKTHQSFHDHHPEKHSSHQFSGTYSHGHHVRRSAFPRDRHLAQNKQHKLWSKTQSSLTPEYNSVWDTEDDSNSVVHVASSSFSSSHPSVSASSSLTSSCPSVCTCKWQKGKKTVSCVSSFLTMIPEGIETDTQVIYLNDNDFADRLTNSIFESHGLTSLQRIYLSRCEIKSVGETFLASLTNLVELDLSQNLLHTIPSESLKSSPFLRRLILSGNHFPVIQDHSFPDLETLQFLDLNHCEVEHITDNAFSGLKSLKSLHLSGNKLTVMSGATIEPLPGLQELHLHANNWTCDCSLRDLREQMIHHRIPLSYSPACHSPIRLQGRQWSTLSLDEFACPPSSLDQIRRNDHISVTEGDDASLECLAESVPKPNLTWVRNGQLVTNGTLLSFGRQIYMIHEKNHHRNERSSRLIISNSMAKDGGLYQCNVTNKAGFIVINLTLEVSLRSRNEMQEPRNVDRGSHVLMYSGETIAGIVFGILLIVLLVFMFVILAVMRYKESIIPSSLQRSSCFTKCLLHGHQHRQRDHHQDQQSAGSGGTGGDRLNNKKIGIIENPSATRNNNMTTSLSSSEGRRANGSLSGMTNGSKYGSVDVIAMMTANNHNKTMSGSQQQQQDIDSGHEEGSYESRFSVVTSSRSQNSNSGNLLMNGIIREEADDDLSAMGTMSNDLRWRDADQQQEDHHEEEEEEESLPRPKVKALEVQGARLTRNWNPDGTPCDNTTAAAGMMRHGRFAVGGGGAVAEDHYVNQHQQRDSSHQFRSTDRLLDSGPASPSIHRGGHHQWHLQQSDTAALQQQRQLLQSSNPRPRGSIVTATTGPLSSPAKYVLRTLSSTPPEFFDHHQQQQQQRRDFLQSNSGNRCEVFNSGSLQRQNQRRSSASPSLISSLISSFTTSPHHLKDRNPVNLNHGSDREFDDPALSDGYRLRHHGLEMTERRGGTAAAVVANRVVTFDLPQSAVSSESSSKSSLLHLDPRHHYEAAASGNPPALRRYSLSGGSLMPISSSTSCLISESSLPSVDVIGSSPSHHLLGRGQRTAAAGAVAAAMAAGSYATLRIGGRKVTLNASPFHDNDPARHQRTQYHVDQERAFRRDSLCDGSGSISKVLTDQHFVQRSFVDHDRPAADMSQRKLITNSSNSDAAHNQILLPDSMSSSSPHSNLFPGNSVPGLQFYGSSSSSWKAPECTRNIAAAASNGLLPVHAVSSSSSATAGVFSSTSNPVSSLSSSGAAAAVMLHATSGLHNGITGCHQLQLQQNRIKYSPDEGLGDERSEFGGGGDESVATSASNAITA